MTITILLADDHVPTRAGVRAALEAAGMTVVIDVGTGPDAVAAAIELRPDACLLDVNMPGGGIQAAAEIAAQVPETTVVMLAAEADDGVLFDALRAGARGYLLKDTDPDRLPFALRGVLKGEAAIPRRLVMRMVDELQSRDRRRRIPLGRPGAEHVTEREWEVLEHLQKELSTRQVAERMGISEVTVRRHLSAAMSKLGAGSRSEVMELLSREEP
ncbi:MAG TPA: response regulator transcription factor [Solirubrobacteraceae bacterium]|nr:response regulator transcription factor [Solirubrobacteraceae bacterium]